MNKEQYYYNLPKERIAQKPLEPRDSSKLLCYSKDEDKIYHKIFRDIVDFLDKGDVLVLNTTRVIPARLYGKKITGAKVEILLLKRLSINTWECMVKPAKRLKEGVEVIISDKLKAVICKELSDGLREVKFIYSGIFEEIIEEIGNIPLPPYITEKLENKERYQTIYSKQKGSSAAPTAGLHFTKELLQKIREKGVEILEITLHVGLGTFKPVQEEQIENHKLHSEYYEISEYVANRINLAKKEKRRVICVGTTSVRTLESAADSNGILKEKKGNTDIFIFPPYNFKIVDCLITNFHLPESTLIMLVSAFIGREKTLNLYQLAIQNNYRFFSFGDAMFIF